MSRKITNKTHSYVQKTLNEVIKIYNFSKKYVDEAININLWPHEKYAYNYHKQMVKASQEVIKDLKDARATICFIYG